jgi:LAS superfamily LD-carboxypeptidase LdcB
LATDLERLVVQLSADIKGYENALNRAKTQTDRQARAIENRFRSMNKSIETSFAGAGRSLSRLGAGFIGGLGAQQLTRLARDAAAAGDAIGDLAEQTGATVESIQILRYAAQQTGSSVEQMDTAMAKFAVNLGEAQKGSGDLAKLLEANGIALKDAAGHARTFNDVFNDVVGLVQRAPDQFAALEVVTTAFGAKNDELVTTLRNGVAGIDAWGNKLQELGGIIDSDGIAALSRLDAKFNDTTVAMEDALKRLVVATGPLINAILGEVIQFANTLGEIADTITLLFAGEFAEAGRLAAHGRESAATQVNRELTSNAEKLLAVEQELKGVQDQLIAGTAGRYAVQVQAQERSLLNQKNLLEIEQRRLEALRESIRLQSMKPSGTGPIGPFAPQSPTTVIPTVGGSGGSGLQSRAASERIAGRIEKLDAEFAEAVATLLAAFPQLKINSAFRTFAEQAELYRRYQAGTGGIAARPGSSLHERGLAVDINFNELSEEEKVKIRKMAEELGLEFPVSLRVNDPGHLQSAEPGMRAGFEAADKAAEDAAKARTDAEQKVADALAKQNEKLAEQKELIASLNWDRYLEDRAATIEAQTAQLDAMRDLASDVFGGIVSDLQAGASAGEIFANVLNKIIARLGDMAVNMLVSSLFGAAGTAQTGLLGSLFTGLAGARAGGGPVMAGSSYMVGEQGPEIFTPSVGGSILPNAGGRMSGELRGVIDINPSPLLLTSVQMATGRMISENNRRMPAYLADRQRRGI